MNGTDRTNTTAELPGHPRPDGVNMAPAAARSRGRARASLPQMPAYDGRQPADIFTVQNAKDFIAAASPVQPMEPSAELLAGRLNYIITEIAGWASIDGSAPKPSELRDALAVFRGNASALLSRMGLNDAGDPREEWPLRTTPFQPWFQWFREASYRLMEAANQPDPTVARVADRKLTRATILASQIVDPSIGHRAAIDAGEIAVSCGHDFPDDNRLTVYRTTMIEEAMKRAGPLLALLTLLAEVAAEVPRDASKSNFQRAYIDQLFVGLVTVWFETFGTVPSGFKSGTNPGGSALAWHKAVLEHAHDMSGRLELDIQGALAEAARFKERTVADRIKDAVSRSRVIQNALKSRQLSAIPPD